MPQEKKIEPETLSAIHGAGVYAQRDEAGRNANSHITLLKPAADTASGTAAQEHFAAARPQPEAMPVVRPKVGLSPWARKKALLSESSVQAAEMQEAEQPEAIKAGFREPLEYEYREEALPTESLSEADERIAVGLAQTEITSVIETLPGQQQQPQASHAQWNEQPIAQPSGPWNFMTILLAVAMLAACAIGIMMILGSKHALSPLSSDAAPTPAAASAVKSPAAALSAVPAGNAPRVPIAYRAVPAARVALPVIPPSSASPYRAPSPKAIQTTAPAAAPVAAYVSAHHPGTSPAAAAPFTRVSVSPLHGAAAGAVQLAPQPPAAPRTAAPQPSVQPSGPPSPKELFSIINKD